MGRVKRLRIFKLCLLLFLSGVFSGSKTLAANFRLHSITPLASFNFGLNLKKGQALKSINGPGAGANIRFTLDEHWNMAFTGGYLHLTVDQPDPIPYWNWEFWNRFYGNYVRDLQRDSNYVAEFTYRQNLNLIPAILLVGYRQTIGQHFNITFQLGAGLYLFKRTLAVHEKWTKYFPEKDYSFSYAFDNHANPHSGNVPVAVFGFESNYRLTEHLNLNLGLNYQQFFETEKENYFPFKRLLQIQIGLQFLH